MKAAAGASQIGDKLGISQMRVSRLIARIRSTLRAGFAGPEEERS